MAGSLTIDDFNETVGTALPQQGARTLAGLVFTRLGRRPAVDDAVDVGDVHVRVVEIDGARITRLALTLPEGVAAPGHAAHPPDA